MKTFISYTAPAGSFWRRVIANICSQSSAGLPLPSAILPYVPESVLHSSQWLVLILTIFPSPSFLPLFSPPSYVGRLHFPLQTINTSGNFLNLTNFPVGKRTPYITGLMLPQLIGYCRRNEWTCSLQLLSLFEISLQRVHICICSALLGSVVWGPFLVGMLEDVYLSSLCMSV